MVRNLSHSAYTHIRLGLLRGDYPPGAPLREVQLAEAIGVSRGPLREAFAKLEDEGLIEQIPNRGAFARVPSQEEFDDLMETRTALEQIAVRKACERITRPQLASLRRILVRAARAARDARLASTPKARAEAYTRWAITDIEFHRAVYDAARNPMLGKMLGRCHVFTRFWAHAAYLMRREPVSTTREGTREHTRIYRAIRANQPRLAASLLAEHLDAARRSRQRITDLQHLPPLPDAIARAIVRLESDIASD